MAEPLDDAPPALPDESGKGAVFVAAAFTMLSVALVVSALSGALTIWYAGLFEPGVSFTNSLSHKTYHVQWPALVWGLPAIGVGAGLRSMAVGHRHWGRRCVIVSSSCAAAMAGLDIYW